MILIAAVDENWGIGNDGQLLTRLSQDMTFFKNKTTNNIIVLGRKTLETFPNKKPLPNRLNVILTHNKNFVCPGATICHSTEEVLEFVASNPDKQAFVAGGGSIYSQFLPYCDTAYITKIFNAFQADTHIENLHRSPNWILSEESLILTENKTRFTFCIYKKNLV